MSQKNINNDPLLGQVIEKHGIPKQEFKTYSFYHVVLIPDWDPEIGFIESKKFKSFKNAEKYMKKHLLNAEERSNLMYEGSGCKGEAYRYNTVYFDKNGNEIDQPDEFDENEHNYNDYFIEIVEDDEDQEEFD
jgi:hypothetical protein